MATIISIYHLETLSVSKCCWMQISNRILKAADPVELSFNLAENDLVRVYEIKDKLF